METSSSPDAEQRTASSAPLPPPGHKRRIDLHRRRAIIAADRIDVRPSRAAIIPPLAGFLFGALCVGLIVHGVVTNAVPYWLLAILLLLALLAVPLSGITLVYALVGANVIFDRAKQSGAWQQGFLGMGIGTTELVPFWKIEKILVRESGTPTGTTGRRTEEFAQWEAVLLKRSGTRLTIAGMTVPRRFERGGLGPVTELAGAVAALTGAPLEIEAAAVQPAQHTAVLAVEPGPLPRAVPPLRRAGTSTLPRRVAPPKRAAKRTRR